MTVDYISSRVAVAPPFAQVRVSSLTLHDIYLAAVGALLLLWYRLQSLLQRSAAGYDPRWDERRQSERVSQLPKPKHNRNIAERLAETDKSIAILYGSQSGTGEGFSRQLSKELQLRFGLGALAVDLDDVDAKSIPEIKTDALLFLVLSTYGEGNPSDNAMSFWRWLQSSDCVLESLNFSAFGLGNSNYKYYNKAVDDVVANLTKKSAQLIFPVGKGDDASGSSEKDFQAWKDGLLEFLKTSRKISEKDPVYDPALSVNEEVGKDPSSTGHPLLAKNRKLASSGSEAHALSINDIRTLTTGSARTCLHVDIDISSKASLKYKTGDHIAIWPSNPAHEVRRCLRLLGLEDKADATVSFTAIDPSFQSDRFPASCSIEVLFRHYLSLCDPVSELSLRSLEQFAPSAEAKGRLQSLRGPSSTALRSFGYILEAAVDDCEDWSDVPLSWVVENVAPFYPRLYSISSSAVAQPKRVSITAVVPGSYSGAAPAPEDFGLATSYLFSHFEKRENGHKANSGPNAVGAKLEYLLDGPADVLKDGKLFCQLRRSNFKMPLSLTSPIIMIGAGTGIAPFRGFIQERARQKRIGGQDVGPMDLYYGCRREDEDYLYRDELHALQEQLEPALRIVTAFSRPVAPQGEAGTAPSKVYVQDKIRENLADVLAKLESPGSFLYICGSPEMALGVVQTVTQGLKELKGWDDAGALQFLERMRGANRWQEDVWG